MTRTLFTVVAYLIAAVSPATAFVPNRPCATCQITALSASKKPLASEGDWTAYLDEDNTGFVYYFNGETGEALWEKPTPTFPDVKLIGSVRRKASEKQAEYLETLQDEKKGFFQTILKSDPVETTTQEEQPKQKKEEGGNDWFGGLFEDAKEKQKEEGFLSSMFAKSETTTVEEPAMETPVAQQEKATAVVEEKKDLFGGMFGVLKKEQPTAEPVATEQPVDTTPAKIETASYVLPHPAKARWGGEDAVFVKGRTFGVFDGVSGAEKQDGVPLYSRTLAEEMKKQVDSNTGMSLQELTASMQRCVEIADETATGASTAVVASITEDGYLRALNLGDSACLVIRDNKILAKTREISHYFDCPYQLSVDSPDRPRDSTKLNIELMKNDLIFMASDGIFDNLTDEQLIEITQSEPQISRLAKRISEISRKVSLDQTAATPYAKQAKRFGDPDYSDGLGGKVDDVSCVVVSYS